MKLKIMIFLEIVFFPLLISAQPAYPALSRDLLYNRIIVNTGNTVNYGFFLGLSADSLLLLKEGEKKDIALDDIEMVRIFMEKDNRSKNLLVTSLLGIHLGNLAFNQGDNRQPFAYITDRGSIFIPSLFGLALFGSLAYFMPKGEQEVEFVFSGDAESRAQALTKFREFIAREGSQLPTSVHLSVQSAYVFNAGAPELKQDSYNFTSRLGDDQVSEVNLVRRLQLSVNVSPDFELGAAVFWLSEPIVYGTYKYSNNNFVDYKRSLQAVGYFATGSYRLFRQEIPSNLIWKTGIGLGRINLDINEKYFNENRSNRISKALPGIAVFSEFDIMMSTNTSIGFMADYVLLPDERVGTVPGSNFPRHTIKMGNTSLGLKLGFHF